MSFCIESKERPPSHFQALQAGVLSGIAGSCLTCASVFLSRQCGLIPQQIPGAIDVDLSEMSAWGQRLLTLMTSPWGRVCILPVVAEVYWRVCVQGAFKYVADALLPNRSVEICDKIKFPLSTLVAIVASSLLLCAGAPASGVAGRMIQFTTSLLLGLVKEQWGFLSCCMAHSVHDQLTAYAGMTRWVTFSMGSK